MGAHFLWLGGVSGRKDAFPGADGSTITQATGTYQNATTIPIYGANGNSLTEGSTGVQRVNIAAEGVVGEDYTTIVYVIKNPLAFIYNSVSPYDWYTNSQSHQDNTLWANSAKTNYDPCPKGWKVPQDGTWNDFSNITMSAIGSGTDVANGRTYNKTAWYPMEGYLHHQSGNLTYVGYNGYCWLSAIENIYARYLSFTLSSINPSYPTNRARGFSVRCVQE